MSLMLAFKKAYTKVFNGEKTETKDDAALFTVILLPLVSSISIAVALGGDYSEQRTPILGDKQYQSLSNEITRLAEKNEKMNKAGSELKVMTQELLFSPNNAKLKGKFEKQQQEQALSRAKLDREVEDFKTRLLLSEGISEKDAIALVDMAEDKTGYTLWPNKSAQDYIRPRMQYLDECQLQTQGAALRKGATFDERGEMVMQCQDLKIRYRRIGVPFQGAIFGIPATAGLLFGMSALGAAFRRKEENETPKPVTTTLKVTYTKKDM